MPFTPFPKGNNYWLKRATVAGAERVFASPAALASSCEEFFEHITSSPLYEAKLTSYQGINELVNVPKMRAATVNGLCFFLGIATSTWYEYSKRDEFTTLCAAVGEMIREQKFAGAAAGLLKEGIITRDLGLVDKTEQTNVNKYEEMSDEELERLIKQKRAALDAPKV